MTFSWKNQLRVGQDGEHLILNGYHSPLVFSHNLNYDFTRLRDGAKIEVKTDTYSMEATENFFFERWGNEADKKPGGPWRSRKHRLDIFIYFFVRDGIYFEFTDIKLLCTVIDKYIKKHKLKPIPIKNRTYITVGYKVPRKAVEALYIEHKLGERT